LLAAHAILRIGNTHVNKNLISIFRDNKIPFMHRRDYAMLAAVFLGACVLYFCWSLFVTEPGYPLDDSWIHQVFARNIATGHGFSFNPDIPISGATAPLWTLLMALLWPICGPIAGGILAGVVFEYLAIVAIYKLTFLITGRRDLAFIVGLITSLTWVLIWGALSCMEIGLYSALSLWGLYFYFRAESFTDKRNYWAYILFTLAFLSRPECVLFLAGATIRDFWEWMHLSKKPIIPWLGRMLPVGILLLPYFAFNYAVTGSLMTQTFAAKTQGKGILSGIINGNLMKVIQSLTVYPVSYIQDFIWNLWWLNPILLIATVVGGLKFISFQDQYKSKRMMLVATLLLYIPLMGIVAPVMVATYHHLRLVDNLVPLFIMLGVTGFFANDELITAMVRKYLWIIGSVLLIIGLIAIMADEYIISILGPRFVQGISRVRDNIPTERLVWYARESGKNSIFVALLVFGSAFLSLGWVSRKICSHPARIITIAIVTAYSLGMLMANGKIYAHDVKNINEMDKRVGLYLNDITSKNQKVAVNDIGAIGYFSGTRILDLKGLISPQITQSMISHDSLAFDYMLNHERVDYVAIFPIWFNYIPRRTDIFIPIKRFGVDWNSILGGDTTIVYKANWP
jgi:hypothetical protein